MKTKENLLIFVILTLSINSCTKEGNESNVNIIYLHHSTGGVIWRGGNDSFAAKVVRRLSNKMADVIDTKSALPQMLKKYNKDNDMNYSITELDFPKEKPYGWSNYPYDYYYIWVKNGGEKPFMEEPTLEILTKDYQVIIFKHCFPVSNIKPDPDTANINSEMKTISNYKLQYLALRNKFHEFPETKFILFTGAAQVKANVREEDAVRAKEFFSWVTNEWDLPDDNIYLWDLYSLQTEGGIYFKDDYAVSSTNSHPNKLFADNAVKLLFNRIIDLVETNGSGTTITGEKI